MYELIERSTFLTHIGGAAHVANTYVNIRSFQGHRRLDIVTYGPPDPLQMSKYRHERAAFVAQCAG
jgi:hypothetical protein